MSIFEKKLSESTTNKAPIKIEVRSQYKIYIMVNDNNYVSGTHAGMLLISPNIFEIYDPNGGFGYPGIAPGNSRLFPVYEAKERSLVYKSYLDFQLDDGGEVYIYKFNISKEDFNKIEDRILNDNCGGSLSCSKCVSNAITGVGVFKNVPRGVFFPSSLKKEMDKLTKPLRIKKN